jgi:cell wall-associated NlpC family hydrolase
MKSKMYRSLFIFSVAFFVAPITSFAASQTVNFAPSTQGLVFASRYIVGSSTASWETVRNATEGNEVRYYACSGCSGEVANVFSDSITTSEGAGYRIMRSILSFDTSSLPDDAVITGAVLHIRPASSGNRSTGDNDAYTYIQPVGPASPQSSTAVELEDFDQVGDVNHPTPWSDTKNNWNDPWSGNSTTDFPFNTNGIDGISKIDHTSLALRQGHDIENVMPDAYNVWRFSAENSYLTVTYEIPEPVTNPVVEKAKAVIGGPYTWGAKGWDRVSKAYLAPADIKDGVIYQNYVGGPTKGLDCSGLTLWSYDSSLNLSNKFPHDGSTAVYLKYLNADGQYRSNTAPVPSGSEQAGDLMFFDWGTYNKALDKFVGPKDGIIDHVALYTGSFTYEGESYDVVHASSPTTGIVPAKVSNLTALTGFVSFGRVAKPDVKLSVKTHSPVDLLITDPQGVTIGPDTVTQTDEEVLREVPGELYYSVYDIASDNTPETEVYSPKLKVGDYIVKPVRRADAATSSVYSITVETDFGSLTVADHVSVSNIPTGGYVVHVTATGVTSFVRDVTAPEARISVDPVTKDLLVAGVDETSTTTVTKGANNTYVITDAAGNTTKLFFQKSYAGKLLTYAKLTGIQYNNSPVTTVAKSSFLYLWNPLVNPPVLLSQTIVVDDTFGIEAVYDKKKNQTTVFVKKKNVVLQKQVFTGLRTVTLTTTKGVMGYQF